MKSIYTFDEILHKVNTEIAAINYEGYQPSLLFEPISYILGLGGKRVRPALALMSCNLYSDEVSRALPIAKGIEIFHNFTLLHDDLMDRADIRRGQPTVHKKWTDNVAILSGDAMLIEAYKEIAKVEGKYLKVILDQFSIMATDICRGQQYDMDFEKRMDVTVEEYIEMIRLKTAVLLGCALKEGAIICDAPETDLSNLYEFGINLGLAFQLKDDLLDVYGDEASFGKRIGGDILCNKKTYLLISALSKDESREELISWINKSEFDENEKIEAVRAIYSKLRLKEQSENLIQEYYLKSIKHLDEVKVLKERKKALYLLAENLMFRKS